MAKQYRVLKEVLHKSWKVGDIIGPDKLEGHDIDWMLTSSKCIEEVAPVQVFQAVANGAGTEGEGGGPEGAGNTPTETPSTPPAPPAKPTTPTTAPKK
jgi:hypothetical protein